MSGDPGRPVNLLRPDPDIEGEGGSVIGSHLAAVLIFAILAFTVVAISVSAMVIGYLERRNQPPRSKQPEPPSPTPQPDQHRS